MTQAARVGVLEVMARADLDAVLEGIERRYRPGALEALTAADPTWRLELDRIEQEVGGLYEALREADATVARWRRALAELSRVWARVGELETVQGPEILGEVA
jgi:hypothetical protein